MTSTTHYETAKSTVAQARSKDPPRVLLGPQSPLVSRDGFDPILFVYYIDSEGRLQQRKHYRQVILRHIQPWRDKRFSYDRVDEVFDSAACVLREAYDAGKLTKGLTMSYAERVFTGVAIDFVRKHGRGPNTDSLSAPIKPNPRGDSGGAAATVEETVAAPRHDQPDHVQLRRLLAATLEEAINELPDKQRAAVYAREQVDFDASKIDRESLGVAWSAHTSAFHDAQRTLKRSLSRKLGHAELAAILAELDIDLTLEPRVEV